MFKSNIMASLKLKIIKSKEFTAQGENYKHYTAAYKGRVFGVSTLRFAAEGPNVIEENNDILTINCECEVSKDKVVDPLTGEVTTFMGIVPKFDLAVGILG